MKLERQLNAAYMIEDGQKELELEKKIREKKVRYNELRIRFGLLPVPLEDLKLKDKGGKAQNLMTWKFDPALKKGENRGKA